MLSRNKLLRMSRSSHNSFHKITLRRLSNAENISKIRNIGVLAHIDAGKTTTTERMLYYSGVIRQMGEVHHGNTVTDFMEQERERGITITSAAVTFYWDKHRFNLLDTPGHIDFTMEVEQTLNVLDGVVVILDSSAGVEAQTSTVWRQADKYNIPRIVYLNKMDRADADMNMCCRSLETKFQLPSIKMHLPIVENKQLQGIVDVLTLEKLTWTKGKYIRRKLSESSDGLLWEKSKELRNGLVDRLSSVNDQLADIIIEKESLNAVDEIDIKLALKQATIQRLVVPVFCGSSYKNIGVQPLMNAIISYLPSPLEIEKNAQYTKCFDNHLLAKAFKVMHDKQRGPLVFFRIYSGNMSKSQRIYNARNNSPEICGKLLSASANEFEEMNEPTTEGNIAVVTGLKNVMTGDLVTNSATTFEKAKKFSEAHNINIFESVARIPEPVFFCSIEPISLSYQVALDNALNEITREDPSLRVSNNEETGQTVLAGMGELHLEIIRDRILKEYKVEVDLGKLQIAYREANGNIVKGSHLTDTKISTSKQYVKVELSLIPNYTSNELVTLDKSPEASATLSHLTFKVLHAIKQGALVGLTHGPKIGAQVVNTGIILHSLEIGKGTSNTIISSTITKCIQMIVQELDSIEQMDEDELGYGILRTEYDKARKDLKNNKSVCIDMLLRDSETRILEPVMMLEIIIPEEYSSSVLSDLSQRRAIIRYIENRGSNRAILSETPLSELLGYSRTIRTISSGTATFSMEFLEYQEMNSIDESKAISSVRGY